MADSNVLQFPTRNKGRIRKSRSPEAMGRCTISLLERDGAAVPENVTDICLGRRSEQGEDGRLGLRLALGIFATLDAEQQRLIRSSVRLVARYDCHGGGDECRDLYCLLTGERLPC